MKRRNVLAGLSSQSGEEAGMRNRVTVRRAAQLLSVVIVLAMLSGLWPPPAAVYAATVVVNDPTDTVHASGCATTGTGTCSLRDAILYANAVPGPEIITLPAGVLSGVLP